MVNPPLLAKKTLDIYNSYRLESLGLSSVATVLTSATLEGTTSALPDVGPGSKRRTAFPQAGLFLEPLRPALAFSPGVFVAITRLRASSRSRGSLIAMRLSGPKRFLNYSLASLAPNYPRKFWFTFPLHSSLLPSGFISSHFSEPWSVELKKSGLLCFGRSSARKNLAYLPCRLARDGSTFHIISGGGKLKKALRLRKPPGRFVPHPFISIFTASFHPISQGVLTCHMMIVVRLQGYSPPTLVSFARRRSPQLAAGSRIRGRESARPSPVRRCEAGPERCVGSPTSRVAGTKRAFFQRSPALAASARITVASPQNLAASSPCNHRPCFSTRPDSACRIPSLTMGAYKIAIGWQPNACGFC